MSQKLLTQFGFKSLLGPVKTNLFVDFKKVESIRLRWIQPKLKTFGFKGGFVRSINGAPQPPICTSSKIDCLLQGANVWQSMSVPGKFSMRFATDGTMGIFVNGQIVSKEFSSAPFPDIIPLKKHIQKKYNIYMKLDLFSQIERKREIQRMCAKDGKPRCKHCGRVSCLVKLLSQEPKLVNGMKPDLVPIAVSLATKILSGGHVYKNGRVIHNRGMRSILYKFYRRNLDHLRTNLEVNGPSYLPLCAEEWIKEAFPEDITGSYKGF